MEKLSIKKISRYKKIMKKIQISESFGENEH
jgi:hypothetical protein